MPRLKRFCWERGAAWAKQKIDEDRPDIVAVDTETTGVGFYDDVFAATLTWRGRDGQLVNVYLGLDTSDTLPVSGAGLDSDTSRRHAVIEYLQGMLRYPRAWVFHNAKFDLQKLILIGAITPDMLAEIELHDTQTKYTLINENDRKGLKHLAATVLKVDDTTCVEVKSGKNKGTWKRVPKEAHQLNAVRRKLKLKKEDGYHLLPREVVIPYALKDTEFTLRLHEMLTPRLEAVGDPRLLELYREFMELKVALLDMEADGFGLDLPYLDTTASEYGVKVMEGWGKVAQLTGNPELNPQSPDQLKAAFLDYAGVHLDSTAEHALKDLIKFQGPGYDLAEALLQYRSDKKIHTTYLKALQDEHRDGIVNPNFNDDAARTGRMSSSAASNN